MNILIGESGGTKTDWALVVEGVTRQTLQTRGLSPSLSSWEIVREIIVDDVVPWAAGASPEHVYFFGAGLGRMHSLKHMERLLTEAMGTASVVKVDTDLMGAAYACLGNDPGLVAILGTGSVAFRYKEGRISQRIGGWGYLLADEGGGFALGRALIRGLLENRFSSAILEAHEDFMDHSLSRTIEDLYSHPRPSLYLARQVPFLAQHLDDEEIRVLVLAQIQYFLDHYLFQLDYETNDEVVFTGGVARIFHELVVVACESRGIEDVRILKEPPILPITRYFAELAV